MDWDLLGAFLVVANLAVIGYASKVAWDTAALRRKTMRAIDELDKSLDAKPSDALERTLADIHFGDPWLGTYNPPRAETDCVFTCTVPEIRPRLTDEQVATLKADIKNWHDANDGQLIYVDSGGLEHIKPTKPTFGMGIIHFVDDTARHTAPEVTDEETDADSDEHTTESDSGFERSGW